MIQNKNSYYFLLKCYADFMFKLAYRRVEYIGKEKIPQDGAIIYAPNHTNTLMDALAVLAIDRQAKVFVARADIFKNPVLLKILTFLKMLPINRKRDGLDSLSKNEEIYNRVVDVLSCKVPFCIMPEGTHRPMHSLMPLKKGIFHIALQANNSFGNEIPVYIVPVGIEYGHFFRFRSSLLVQIGEPINVTKSVNEHSDMGFSQHITALRDKLADNLKKIILQISDDKNYNGMLQYVQMYGKKEKSLIKRFATAKEIISNVIKAKHTSSLQKSSEFFAKRHALGIGMNSILKQNILLSITGELLLLLAGFPYFIFSVTLTSPVTLLSEYLCLKFKDKAFHNSVRFLIALVLLPILLTVFGIIAFATFLWQWATVFVLLFIPSFYFLHEYLRLIRIFISDIKWLKNKNPIKDYI